MVSDPVLAVSEATGALVVADAALTHASMLKSVPMLRTVGSLTYALPLKTNAVSASLTIAPAAPPDTPYRLAVWPCPDESAAVEPDFSPRRQYACGPSVPTL